MYEIKSREEAIGLVKNFGFRWHWYGRNPSETLEMLENFFLTEEQKEAMNNAAYKFALQIGVDPDFAKFYYYEAPVQV